MQLKRWITFSWLLISSHFVFIRDLTISNLCAKHLYLHRMEVEISIKNSRKFYISTAHANRQRPKELPQDFRAHYGWLQSGDLEGCHTKEKWTCSPGKWTHTYAICKVLKTLQMMFNIHCPIRSMWAALHSQSSAIRRTPIDKMHSHSAHFVIKMHFILIILKNILIL